MDVPLPPATPPLNHTELVERINAALPDNEVQGISPEDVRSRLLELVDSCFLLVDVPGASLAVSAYQMRRALVSLELQDDVYAMLGDTDAIPRIQWDSCALVVPGDPLALNIQATLSYSNAEMDALFVLARTF